MIWPGLPVLVRLAGRPVILLGEGDAAAAKRRLLERAGAVVVAEHPDARLAIVAIEEEAEARAAVSRLRARGVLVNAVDRPELCDFTLPAVVDRAPVLVAVSTGGASAGVAAALRQRLEVLLPSGVGRLASTLFAARDRLRVALPDPAARRRAMGAALAGPLDPLDGAAPGRVEAWLRTPHAEAPARLIKIGLTSADPDDLTLRQAGALALADQIYHADQVPPAILDRARADAPRIACSGPPGQVPPGTSVWVDMG